MLLCNSMSGLLYIHSLTFAGMMNGYPTFVASILAIGGNTAIIGLSSINKNKLFFFNLSFNEKSKMDFTTPAEIFVFG